MSGQKPQTAQKPQSSNRVLTLNLFIKFYFEVYQNKLALRLYSKEISLLCLFLFKLFTLQTGQRLYALIPH